jgi:cadmium resistance protein CadD (predicted permease)
VHRNATLAFVTSLHLVLFALLFEVAGDALSPEATLFGTLGAISLVVGLAVATDVVAAGS